MTEELVVWVLLFSSVGLLWVFTCAILTKDNRSRLSRPNDEPQHMNEADAVESNASRGKVAA